MKTIPEYKENLIKRSSIGFLLKCWRLRYSSDPLNDDFTGTQNGGDVIIFDVVASREIGFKVYHKWAEDDFQKILDENDHWKRKKEGKHKRTLLAKKYRNGRQSHKK